MYAFLCWLKTVMLRAGDLSNIQEAEFRIFREIVGQKEFSKISAIRSAALAVILFLALCAKSWKKLFDLNPDRYIITFLWRPTCSPISSQNKPRLTSHDAPNWWHYLIARRETKNDSDEETGLDSEISERHKIGHLYIVKDNSTLNPKPTHTNSICQSL